VHFGRRFVVELQEVDDIEARRRLDQSLLQSQQQAIDFVRSALGFVARDIAARQSSLLAMVTEEDAVTATLVFKASHRCGSNVTQPLLSLRDLGGQFGTLQL
jgi:hypothetical protein